MKTTIFATVTALATFLLAAPMNALAGPGEAVSVRAIDIAEDVVLAEESVGLQTRLALKIDDATQYLGLRRGQFRGQQMLEISLADERGTWETASSTTWRQPSRQQFGERLVLELEPQDWAELFCRELEALETVARRDTAVSLNVDGQKRYLNPVDWDGSAKVALIQLGEDVEPGPWSVEVAEQHLLLNGPEWSEPVNLGEVRRDFPMTRTLEADGRQLQIDFVPSAYPEKFCAAYAEGGTTFAEETADYFFGRASD